MSATPKTKRFVAILGLAGFLISAWSVYECGLNLRNSAYRAYTLSQSEGIGASQMRAAARQNHVWALATGASLVLALMFLSACFFSKQGEVRRRGVGLLVLLASFLPVMFANPILSPLLNLNRTLPPGARVTAVSFGGITLEGWQMYAGAAVFILAALAMVSGGAYLLLGPSKR